MKSNYGNFDQESETKGGSEWHLSICQWPNCMRDDDFNKILSQIRWFVVSSNKVFTSINPIVICN